MYRLIYNQCKDIATYILVSLFFTLPSSNEASFSVLFISCAGFVTCSLNLFVTHIIS